MTVLVEMKDKEFTSHKAKYALQFGTNDNMIGLSKSFKSIKQKIQKNCFCFDLIFTEVKMLLKLWEVSLIYQNFKLRFESQ